MSSALIQSSLNGSAIIVIALVVMVLVVGLMVFLFARSGVQRREREGRVRERMLEMEREGQFATAADRVPISRNPVDVALEIARLLREHLSMPVLAVYSGRAPDADLSDILQGKGAEASGESTLVLPASVPGSLLTEHTRPAVVRRASIAAYEQASPPVANEPKVELEQPAANGAAPVEETQSTGELVEENQSTGPQQPEENQSTSTQQVEQSRDTEQFEIKPLVATFDRGAVIRGGDDVMLLPWHGPFGWRGLIVTSSSSVVTPDALDPYGQPLARLTDRLAVALEFEHSDLVNDALHQQTSRTTDFSRSLISCLEEASPLDAVVREVTRLVSSDSAALWRIDESSGMVRMVAAHGLRSAEFLPLPVGQGLAGSVAQTREVHAIVDAPADPRCIFPREARESGILSYLGAPLTSDGKTLGVIEAHCANRRTWTEGDRRALESAATIIAELVKSTDSRGNRIRVESAYLGLSESLQRLRSAGELKEAVVEVLGHALGASRVVVVEFNDLDRPEPVRQEYRQPSVKSALGATFGAGLVTGLAAAAPGGQPIPIVDAHERSLAGAETAAELGILSEIAAPIRLDGRTRAVVYVHQCDRVREWEPDEVEFAERVVRQLSLSLTNLREMEAASSDAQQARAESRRVSEIKSKAPAQIKELERKLAELERALAQSQGLEEQGRGMLAKASALEAKARAESDISRRNETEVRQQLERLQQEHTQAQGSARQLLEINRLKSEFIVNAGHEIEASLQSVLGLAELLERGSYGSLTTEQREAVHGIYGWARRIKSDVDWLVEYGSARSRRLESSGGS